MSHYEVTYFGFNPAVTSVKHLKLRISNCFLIHTDLIEAALDLPVIINFFKVRVRHILVFVVVFVAVVCLLISWFMFFSFLS